jgi:lipoyl(octanoyl) transferase
VHSKTEANPSELTAAHFMVRDLGRLAYGPALEEQRRVNQAVIAREAGPTVLLVEHEPVITISQRCNARQHLIGSEAQLHQRGIAVHETDRGGDITYHGPGQLVAYPILRLNPLGLNLSSYMRLLERVVIDTLAAFGIAGIRYDAATGVWVAGGGVQGSGTRDQDESGEGSQLEHEQPTPHAKICAMGVRVRKNVTMHGLALNVAPDLSHFEMIVPCGLASSEVTSLRAMLGEAAPSMAQVKGELVRQLEHACRAVD